MNDEDAISFVQFAIDRFFGQSLTDQIIRNTLSDWRRGMEGKTAEQVDEWYEGKQQMDEDSYREDA